MGWERDLFYILKKFGFGLKFIHWIKVLYTSPVAAVHTNNHLAPFFYSQCGTRQGCPLSPLLFALVIEPLALHIALREQVTIRGIDRRGIEHKVSLYYNNNSNYSNLLEPSPLMISHCMPLS